MRRLLLATAIAGLWASGAIAAPITGTWTVNVYNFNAGGSSANADASLTNLTAHTGSLIDSLTYTGDINFNLASGGTNTIAAFFASAPGGLISSETTPGALNVTMSTGTFQTTTLLDFLQSGSTPAGAGSVIHDDGVTVMQGLATLLLSPTPTVPITSTFTSPGGPLRFIYSGANGLPEVLQASITPAPEPVSIVLLGTGLVGLGLVRARKRA